MRTSDEREVRRASLRLAVQFGVLILVLFAVLGGVVYVIVAATQNESANRIVDDASQVDSPHDVPPGVYLTITGPQGTITSPNMPKGLPDETALNRVQASGRFEEATVTLNGQDYFLRTAPAGDHWVQVAYSLQEQERELGGLIAALAVSGVLAAVAAAGLSIFMARRAMRPLAAALSLQRRFVADAGHELRTPLTLLSTRAQLVRRRLHEGAVDHAVIDGVDEIVDDSRALTEIVEDLLLAADPRQSAPREPVDLAEAATAAAKAIEPRAKERSLDLSVVAPEPVVVSAAPVAVRRLVIALLDNAIDHAASLVRVSVVREGRDAVLTVEDDGAGFPQEDPDRAFERFGSTRADEAPVAGSRHYGLGLALVAEVTARHGGSVKAANTGPGGGAAVTVTLPMADS